MAMEEVINASDISNVLWPLVSKALSPVMTLIKIVGIVFLIYIIYLIIRGIFAWRRNKRMDIMYEKVFEIDRKLDELLKRTAKKEKITEKSEKRAGFFCKIIWKKRKTLKKTLVFLEL